MARVRIYQDQNTGAYSIRVNQENLDSADENSPWRLLGDFDIGPDEGIFMRPSFTGGAQLENGYRRADGKRHPNQPRPRRRNE